VSDELAAPGRTISLRRRRPAASRRRAFISPPPRPLGLVQSRLAPAAALLGAITLLFVFLLNSLTDSKGTVNVIGFPIIVAAAWLLPRNEVLLLICLGSALDVLCTVFYGLSTVTAVSQVGVLIALGGMSRLAAVSARLLTQSERRAQDMDAERRRVAELEQAKSDFLRLAAHEIRSPLTVVLGYVDLWEDGAFGEVSPTMCEKLLPVVRMKVTEMVELADAMVETARIDDSRFELRLEPVDARSVLTLVGHRVRPLLSKEHRIVLELTDEPALVNGDPARLTTVFLNLVTNGIKYSPEGGEIRCALRVESGRVTATVTDSGIGIAAEDIPRLFTRFTRVVRGAHSEIPGTGLGLYLARELVRKHSGDISVKSTLGAGTTVTVSLPQYSFVPATISSP
jgi:signal transduction histidine kinase